MIHKQIWLEAAEAFLTPLEQRTERQLNLTEFGLCKIIYLSKTLLYDYQLFKNFTTAFDRGSVYWLPTRRNHPYRHTTKHDELRGLLSLFLATMTVKEFKQLLIKPKG